jgi:hypothetical protein
MSKFFADRPMLGFLVVSVLAALISAWALNPQSSPIDTVKALIGGLNLAKTVAAVLILLAGAAITYIAWRLGGDPTAMGLVPARRGLHRRPQADRNVAGFNDQDCHPNGGRCPQRFGKHDWPRPR